MVETRKVFHEELEELDQDVIRLAALATESIQRGTDALLDADLSAVGALVEHDRVLDGLTHSIEHRTYLLLARQNPMATDLRMLVTVLRVIHEIERIGDLMVKVAKATRRLYPRPLDPKIRGIVHRMRLQAVAQLGLAVDAYAERDASRALALADMDDEMDDLQKELFRTIFASQVTDDAAVQVAVQIALVGRYYERIADHAVNFGERVVFMVSGTPPEELHQTD